MVLLVVVFSNLKLNFSYHSVVADKVIGEPIWSKEVHPPLVATDPNKEPLDVIQGLVFGIAEVKSDQ